MLIGVVSRGYVKCSHIYSKGVMGMGEKGMGRWVGWI